VPLVAHAGHLWHVDPAIAGVAAAAGLYALGLRRRASRSRKVSRDALFFAAGLAALAVALASPLASVDDELFWAHMAQHVLLLAVAPPLLLLGRPWPALSRTLPLRLRRTAAHSVLRVLSQPRLRVVWRGLTGPTAAQVLFVGTLAVWHLPALFDATLRSVPIHTLEHGMFLAAGLLLWSHLVDSPPVRSRLGYPARALHATVATAAGWLLAITLALGSEPVYEGYARLSSRPGGISALADQHLAAGIMWVPGSIPFAVAILFFAYRWLDESAQEGQRAAARAAEGR
jgi:cytochrome c oxidase assembly factor CtaG